MWGQNVATNMGKTLLQILDEEFCPGHILQDIQQKHCQNSLQLHDQCKTKHRHAAMQNKYILVPINV